MKKLVICLLMFSVFNCFVYSREVRKNQTESWNCDYSARAGLFDIFGFWGKCDVSFYIDGQYVVLDGGKEFIVKKNTKLTDIKYLDLPYFPGDGERSSYFTFDNVKMKKGPCSVNKKSNMVFTAKYVYFGDEGVDNYLTLSFVVDDDSPTITGLPANGWTNKRDLYFSASDKTTNIYDIAVENADNYENLGNNNYYLRLDDVETTVDLYVYDEVLNVTHKEIKTDYTAPEINILILPKDWQNEDVTIRIQAIDERSGIKRLKVIDKLIDRVCDPDMTLEGLEGKRS